MTHPTGPHINWNQNYGKRPASLFRDFLDKTLMVSGLLTYPTTIGQQVICRLQKPMRLMLQLVSVRNAIPYKQLRSKLFHGSQSLAIGHGYPQAQFFITSEKSAKNCHYWPPVPQNFPDSPLFWTISAPVINGISAVKASTRYHSTTT